MEKITFTLREAQHAGLITSTGCTWQTSKLKVNSQILVENFLSLYFLDHESEFWKETDEKNWVDNVNWPT